MTMWWPASLAMLATFSVAACCRGVGIGCSNDQDCKGDRVCSDHQCVDAPRPPPTTARTTRPTAAPPTKPRSVVRRYRCTSGTPSEVRGGCVCGDQIINLCSCSGGICSPEFTIQGDTCVFTCPN